MGKPLRAKDIMIREIITVPHDMDIWEVAHLFTVKGITGAPVIDEKGDIVGVVSQTDIIRHLKEVAMSWSNVPDFYAEADRDCSSLAIRSVKARDIMAVSVIQASEEATVSELSHIMLRDNIHRVIITRDRKFVGIVTTMDMLKVL